MWWLRIARPWKGLLDWPAMRQWGVRLLLIFLLIALFSRMDPIGQGQRGQDLSLMQLS